MTGRLRPWALTLAHTDKTLGNAVQDIVLPNASYNLKVWVKSSGGQDMAKLYAVGHGGAEMSVSVTGKMDEWTEVTIPHITVSTGRVQVGAYVEGSAGQWLKLDDFTLVRDN